MNLSGLFHCSIFSCSEKTAPEEQAGAARSTDRRETRGMSLYLSVYDYDQAP